MSGVFRILRVALTGAALLATQAATAASFQTLYSFTGGADGDMPLGRLVLGSTGLLYGTTDTGGTGNGGTLFQLDPASGALTTLYSFALGSAAGSGPAAGLLLGPGGVLYGTTQRGGGAAACAYGCGTVFKFNPATLKLTTLHAFSGAADGATPSARLVRDSAGQLYGTTNYGGYQPSAGATGYGTVFKLDPVSKTLTTLHQFNITDGAHPQGALTFDSAGLLWGTAASAGPYGSGVVYKINPATSVFALVHGFDYHVDGSSLLCDVVFRNGALIGTTNAGGPTASNGGTVFSLDPATGSVSNLYSFTGGSDGQFPTPGVVSGPHGLLYGTANQGGTAGAGTVFAVNPVTHAYTLVHNFIISDGSQPDGGLLPHLGVLYGVTSGGGRGHGTVFKMTP